MTVPHALPEFRPSDDALLLEFLLSGDGAAEASWSAWTERVDLDDTLWPARQLLPAVAARLDTLGISHPWRARLHGIRRRDWTKNQVHRRTADLAIEMLNARAIEVISSSDIEISAGLASPDDYALEVPRLTVRWEQSGAAIQALQDGGWQVRDRSDGSGGALSRVRRTTWQLVHEAGSIELTNHYNPWIHDGRGDDGVWERLPEWSGSGARPAPAGDLAVAALLDAAAHPTTLRWALAYRSVVDQRDPFSLTAPLDRAPADVVLACVASRLRHLADAHADLVVPSHLSELAELAARADARPPHVPLRGARRLLMRPAEAVRALRRYGGPAGVVRYLRTTRST